MALGGGGTAYLTGFESLFVNPANLYIQEKSYSFQLSLFQGGFYHDTLLPIDEPVDRLKNLRKHTRFLDAESNLKRLQGDDYTTLLNRNYPNNNLRREFLTETDFYWFGIKWVRPDRSYAASFRTRYATRYELGKGLFTNTPVDDKNNTIIDKSLFQKTQVFHEFSLGYAESFTYLNGLLPQLSEFIIGIAPKLVISGASIEANYNNVYMMDSESTMWQQNVDYTQETSGVISDYANPFFDGSGLPAQADHTFGNLLNPAGIGAGLDIGVTYLITFGDDLSILRQQNQPTEKSLRLSLSVTDLGAVYQFKSPVRYASEYEVHRTDQVGDVSDRIYMGAPNEHYLFLSQFEDFNNLTSYSKNEESYELLLPTSLQAGILFQYQLLKLMGDFSYSLSESPFNHSGLASYIGIELRPVPFIPIRGGTRFAKNMAGYYSFGTGVETKRFDLNLSVLLKSRKIGPTSELLGVSTLGFKLYLQ